MAVQALGYLGIGTKQPVLPCNVNRWHLSINGWFLT
jgi:hypothetical protein